MIIFLWWRSQPPFLIPKTNFPPKTCVTKSFLWRISICKSHVFLVERGESHDPDSFLVEAHYFYYGSQFLLLWSSTPIVMQYFSRFYPSHSRARICPLSPRTSIIWPNHLNTLCLFCTPAYYLKTINIYSDFIKIRKSRKLCQKVSADFASVFSPLKDFKHALKPSSFRFI